LGSGCGDISIARIGPNNLQLLIHLIFIQQTSKTPPNQTKPNQTKPNQTKPNQPTKQPNKQTKSPYDHRAREIAQCGACLLHEDPSSVAQSEY
jgi:cell division protein FtsN